MLTYNDNSDQNKCSEAKKKKNEIQKHCQSPDPQGREEQAIHSEPDRFNVQSEMHHWDGCLSTKACV